jgi:hypothetical protein
LKYTDGGAPGLKSRGGVVTVVAGFAGPCAKTTGAAASAPVVTPIVRIA